MLTIAGHLDRGYALVRSEAAKQRHSVAQVLTQLTIVSKPEPCNGRGDLQNVGSIVAGPTPDPRSRGLGLGRPR
jgi:hypothetical protein